MTNRTGTLSEMDSQPSEAIPVQKVASPIDSTRPILPQLFGLGGQTEIQTQTEMERSIVEKDSQLESLARNPLIELKALKNTVSTMGAKHEKQVEAIHEFYKKMNSWRLTEDKSKAEAMRVAMDGKVDIKAIKRFSAMIIENSV